MPVSYSDHLFFLFSYFFFSLSFLPYLPFRLVDQLIPLCARLRSSRSVESNGWPTGSSICPIIYSGFLLCFLVTISLPVVLSLLSIFYTSLFFPSLSSSLLSSILSSLLLLLVRCGFFASGEGLYIYLFLCSWVPSSVNLHAYPSTSLPQC